MELASYLLPADVWRRPNRSNVSSANNTCPICITTDGPEKLDNENAYAALIQLERYLVPIICVFGLVGNTIATVLFIEKALREMSCILYLFVRSVSDNGFLLALLLVWSSATFELRLGQVPGVCKGIVFLTYVCACVSVWTVVYLTFENYIRICHPFTVSKFCTPRKAKAICVVLLIMTMVFYNFPLWLTNHHCSPYRNQYVTTHVFVLIDSLITLVIPSVVIAFLMILISMKLTQIIIRYKQINESLPNRRAPIINRSPMIKITKMLFVVSLVFFVLNLPSHVIRIYLLIGAYINGYTVTPKTEAIFQTLFQLIYYCSFSVNIIIYTTFDRRFRRVFEKILNSCACTNTEVNGRQNREAVNLVQARLAPSSSVNLRRQRSYFLTVGKSDQCTTLVKEERV